MRILQLSTSGDLLEEMSVRWIDMIRHCVTQQTEQRRGLYHRRIIHIMTIVDLLADIKHRSSSLDHSSQSHRRRFSNRKTVPIRIPYVLLSLILTPPFLSLLVNPMMKNCIHLSHLLIQSNLHPNW